MGGPACISDYASNSDLSKRKLKTGITDFKMQMRDFDGNTVVTKQSATVTLSNQAGAHMSRIVKALVDKHGDVISVDEVLLDQLLASHPDGNESVYWKCSWTSFYMYDDPSYLTVDIKLEGNKSPEGASKWFLSVTVPYASVCPCSAQMCDETNQGHPHMQRGNVTITGLIDDTDLDSLLATTIARVIDTVKLVPRPLMKRPDEIEWCHGAAVTNLFVEDSARQVAASIDDLYPDYVVVSKHFESIHEHNVIAVCRKGDKLL